MHKLESFWIMFWRKAKMLPSYEKKGNIIILLLVLASLAMLYVSTDIKRFILLGKQILLNVSMMVPDQRGNSTEAPKEYLTRGKPPVRLSINYDHGRLGNKMFKYASLLGIANSTGRLAVVGPYTNDLNMEQVFHLTHVVNKSLLDSIRWRVIGEGGYGRYDTRLQKLPPEDVRLSGYLQSWKYFINIEDQLREEFKFRPQVREQAKKILNEIRQKYSQNENIVLIGVHARQLDNPLVKNRIVSRRSYYMNALEKMKSILPGKRPIFLVTGNELQWCRDNINGTDVIVLNPAPAEIHFAVLASCNHVIVSSGSYGWWAGWLAKGFVIFNKNWPYPGKIDFHGFVYDDYFLPTWIPVAE